MDNIGLIKGEVNLYDYDESYEEIYNKEKDNLIKIYKDRIFKINHIGSTSIHGIKSKPIIDILIETNDLEDFKNYTESNIESDTYTVKKEVTSAGDYLIRKEEDGKVKAFIHVYKTGDENATNCIIFRDYLNSHAEERLNYEKLKIDLFNKYKDNRKEYTLGKNEFIKEIINKAKKNNK